MIHQQDEVNQTCLKNKTSIPALKQGKNISLKIDRKTEVMNQLDALEQPSIDSMTFQVDQNQIVKKLTSS